MKIFKLRALTRAEIKRGIAGNIGIWALSAAILLGGCSKTDGGEPVGPDRPDKPVGGTGDMDFMISIEGQTRVVTDAAYKSDWEAGDEIGVFGLFCEFDSEKKIIVDQQGKPLNFKIYHNNEKLTFDGASWNGNIYWPTDGAEYYFFAYYPYDAANDAVGDVFPTINLNVSGTQSLEAEHKRSDLLVTSYDFLESYGKSDVVPLRFEHVSSMVEVDISERNFNVPFYQADALTVTIKEIEPGLTVDYTDSRQLLTAGVSNDIKMYRVQQPGDANYYTKYTYRAFVPGQSVAGELFSFVQTVDGTDGRYDFSLGYESNKMIDFQAGRVHKYKIKITEGSMYPVGRYALGDVWPHTGEPQGVVYWLDRTDASYVAADPDRRNQPTGKKGKVMSLGQAMLPWTTKNNVITYARNSTDGLANMHTMKSFSPYLADYPAFEWIDAMNLSGTIYASGSKEVWFFPALEEFRALIVGYTGRMIEDIVWSDDYYMPGYNDTDCIAARAAFDSALYSCGSSGFICNEYLNSTEVLSYGLNMIHYMDIYSGTQTVTNTRTTALGVCAIMIFDED